MRTLRGTITSLDRGEAIVTAPDGQRAILRGVAGLEIGQSVELEVPAALMAVPAPAKSQTWRSLILWIAIIVVFVIFYQVFRGPR